MLFITLLCYFCLCSGTEPAAAELAPHTINMWHFGVGYQYWLNIISQVRETSRVCNKERRMRRESKQIPAKENMSNTLGETGDTGKSVWGQQKPRQQWILEGVPNFLSRNVLKMSGWLNWAEKNINNKQHSWQRTIALFTKLRLYIIQLIGCLHKK